MQFNHANIKLNKSLDKAISYFIVSPDMHKVHHHYQLHYTDSNYGNIFSIWDRLFGTVMTLDRRQLIYGVNLKGKQKLKIPFKSAFLYIQKGFRIAW